MQTVLKLRYEGKKTKIVTQNGRVREAIFATHLFMTDDYEEKKDRDIVVYQFDKENGEIGGQKIEGDAGKWALLIARKRGWIQDIEMQESN